MSETLTRFDRVHRALRGQDVDRMPISLWRRPTGDNHTAASLADLTIELQHTFDLDFVRLTPPQLYAIRDYGATVRPGTRADGMDARVESPIERLGDWHRLRPVDPRQGSLGQQIDYLRRVRAALGPTVPLLQPIYDPLTMALQLTGDAFPQHIRSASSLIVGLERMTDDVIEFGRACLEAGADGFFLETQTAIPNLLPDDRFAFNRLGLPRIRRLARALRPGAGLTVLHLHGFQPFFNLADKLPVDGVSWHDQRTYPDLRVALGRTRHGLIGGIDHRGPVAEGRDEAARSEVRASLSYTRGRRLVLVPGCILPAGTPDSGLHAIRDEAARWSTTAPPPVPGFAHPDAVADTRTRATFDSAAAPR